MDTKDYEKVSIDEQEFPKTKELLCSHAPTVVEVLDEVATVVKNPFVKLTLKFCSGLVNHLYQKYCSGL